MKKLSQNGFSGIEGLLVVAIIAIIGFAGWWVYKSRTDTNKTLANTSQGAGDAQKSTKPKTTPAAYTVPKGFVVYENKDIGLKFAYPQSIWGDISKPSTTTSTNALNIESIDTYAFNHSGSDYPRHYDTNSSKWVDANGKMPISTYAPTEYTAVNKDKVFVFLGNGGQDGSSRWIVIKHGTNMVEFIGPFIDASAKLDTAVTGNRKAYLQADFDKDVQTFLTTFVTL